MKESLAKNLRSGKRQMIQKTKRVECRNILLKTELIVLNVNFVTRWQEEVVCILRVLSASMNFVTVVVNHL